jgi:hypothetical protein
LTTTSLASTLESFCLLRPAKGPFGENYPTSPEASVHPLRLDALKCLSLSPTYQENTGFRTICPNLICLHIHLDERGYAADFGSPQQPYILPPGRGKLRELAVSASQDDVTPAAVFGLLVSVLQRAPLLDKVTLRDMTIQADITYDAPELPLDAHIQELVFENVKISFIDRITSSEPGEPVDLQVGWKPMLRLRERASVVRLESKHAEEVLRKSEWEEMHKIYPRFFV